MAQVGTGVGIAGGIAVFAAALAAPLGAQAAQLDYLDAYYIPDSTLELTAPDTEALESEEGDGFGVKLAMSLTDSIFFSGEYQATETEFDVEGTTVEGTADISRFGVGYNTSIPLYVLVEYVQADYGFSSGDLSVDEAGFAAHLGFKFDLIEFLTLEARGGYVDVGDYDGFEYLGGLSLNLDRGFGLYADYHVIDVENADGLGLKSSDLRTGLRFNF